MGPLSELFALSAIAALVFGLLSRFIAPSPSVLVQWHGTGYVFAPGSACFMVATFLCLFAALYSLWMIPLNQTAGMWHFWLTSISIAVYWLSFYLLAHGLAPDAAGTTGLSSLNKAAAFGQVSSILVVLVAQVIFIVNFISGVAKIQRFHR